MSRIHLISLLFLISACDNRPAGFNKPESNDERFALLVSVSEYGDNLTQSLSGPGNDMDAWDNLLTSRFQFKKRNISRLRDVAATRENILSGLEQLSALAAPGRVLVFGFAGHGSYVPDQWKDGEGFEEPDGRDETLCPYDRRDITDDTLFRIFSRILSKGAFLTVVIDACFAGGAQKDLPGKTPGRRTSPSTWRESKRVLLGDNGYLIGNLRNHERLTFLAAVPEELQTIERNFEEGALPAGVFGVFSHRMVNALLAAPVSWSWSDLFYELNPSGNSLFSGGGLRNQFFGTTPLAKAFEFRVKGLTNKDNVVTIDVGSGGLHYGEQVIIYERGPSPQSLKCHGTVIGLRYGEADIALQCTGEEKRIEVGDLVRVDRLERLSATARQDTLLHWENPLLPEKPNWLAVSLERGTFDEETSGRRIFRPAVGPGTLNGNCLKAKEVLRLRYRNLTDHSIFVTVFYLTASGDILPWNGAQYAVPIPPEQEVTLSELIEIGPPFGKESVKLFISRESPFDPTPFLQTKSGTAEVKLSNSTGWYTLCRQFHTVRKEVRYEKSNYH